jgi:hypothetical protein
MKHPLTNAQRQQRFRERRSERAAAEIERLKTRIAQLEAENTRLKSDIADKKPEPALIEVEGLQPAHEESRYEGIRRARDDVLREEAARRAKPTKAQRPITHRDRRREDELRHAVKEAERAVVEDWRRAPDHLKNEAYHAVPPPKRGYMRMGPLDIAKGEARSVAREELRAQWAREDAEAKVELPPHITRITTGIL